MTEDNQEQPLDNDGNNLVGKDWFLCDLVKYANLGVEIPVTLTVGGVIISGRVTSGRNYFQKALDGLKGDADPDVMDALKTAFSGHVESYTLPKEIGDDFKLAEPDFIHLSDAKIFTNEKRPLPNNEGVYWRGRIEAVDGFWLGALSVEQS